jgi:hypothetical protein
MYLFLDFLHKIALSLDELLVTHDVELLRLDIAFDEGVANLFPLVALEELDPFVRKPLIHHANYYSE